jgi:hypothetical protein
VEYASAVAGMFAPYSKLSRKVSWKLIASLVAFQRNAVISPSPSSGSDCLCTSAANGELNAPSKKCQPPPK